MKSCSRLAFRRLRGARTRRSFICGGCVTSSFSSIRFQSNSAQVDRQRDTEELVGASDVGLELNNDVDEMDESSLRSLLSASRKSNYKDAAQVLELFSRKNVLLQPEEVTSLLESRASDDLQLHFKKAFNLMRRKSQPLTSPLAAALISYFRKHNMIREALNVNAYVSIKRVPKDADLWAQVCRLYGTMDRKDLLKKVVSKFTSELNTDKKHQDILTNPAFLEGSVLACGDCNDPSSLTKILEARQVRGIPHDINVFTSLFKVGLKSGNSENAFAVFPQMRKAQIQPNITFMNELMTELRRAGKYSQMDSIFERMNKGDPFYPKPNAQSIAVLLQGTIDKYKDLRANNQEGLEVYTSIYPGRVEQLMQLIKADKEVYSQVSIQDMYAEYLSHIHGSDTDQFFNALESHLVNVRNVGLQPSAKIMMMMLRYYVSTKNHKEAFKLFDFLRSRGLHTHEAYGLIEQASLTALNQELERVLGPLHSPFEKAEGIVQNSRVMRRRGARMTVPAGDNPKMVPNPLYNRQMPPFRRYNK